MIKLPESESIIEVPFYDVDIMEVVWHGNYAKYFEVARSVMLDKISYNYKEMRESGYSWPVTEMKLRYIQPARFGQSIKVQAKMTEYELRMKIEYVILDAVSGGRLTKGHTIQVPVKISTQEMVFGTPQALVNCLEKIQ